MIGIGFLRCFFFCGVMFWYTTSVWQTVDKYFRDQFREYLEKEYESNAEIKKDVMMEAQRMATKKALIEKIAKMGFTKELEKADFQSTLMGREKLGRTGDVATEEYLRNKYGYGEKNTDADGIITEGTVGNVGPEGTGETGGTVGTVQMDESIEAVEATVSEGTSVIAEEDVIGKPIGTFDISGPEGMDKKAIGEPQEEESFQYRFTEEEECKIDECGDDIESEKEFEKWRGRFDEDDEMCRLEDIANKDSCIDP